jgi:hypothetical protein
MPPLSRADVHVDTALSNVSQKLMLPDLVAFIIAPVVPVVKESDVYWKFGREEMRDLKGRDVRGLKEEATVFRWEPSGTEGYVCEERALKDCVPDRVVTNSDAVIRPMIRAVEKLTYALRLQHEIRIADLIVGPATTVPGAPVAVKWDDPAADIEADVKDAKETVRLAIGVEPNTIIMSAAVANKVVDFLKASAEISIQQRISLFEMPDVWLGMRVVVVRSQKNTAEEGAAEVIADVWPDTVTLAWINPRQPALDDASLVWTIRSRDFRVKRWRAEERDSTWLQADWVLTEKLVTPTAGFNLEDVLT